MTILVYIIGAFNAAGLVLTLHLVATDASWRSRTGISACALFFLGALIAAAGRYFGGWLS